MAVSPNTILYLLKSPIELDNLNQLTFASKQAQENYFLSLPKIEVDKITYQRKDSVIRFPAHIDSIIEYNYCMYQNSNYTNKWFYAFIEHMEYVSDTCTLITIKTDVYQTWMFDINIKRSFVIREHTNNDTFGANTVPENVETGDFIQNGDMIDFTYLTESFEHSYFPYEFYICIGSNRDLNDGVTFSPIPGDSVGGIFSGVKYFLFEDAADATTCLGELNRLGYISAVESIFLVPKDFEPDTSHFVTPTGQSYKVGYPDIDKILTMNNREINIDMKTTLDGYTPVNNKLLTSQFNYLYVTNFTGADTIYKYEYFKGHLNEFDSCKFGLNAALIPGCSIELIPLEYQETGNRYAESTYTLPAPKLPLCNWNNDQYTNWLAQSSVNRTLQTVTSAGSILVGTALMATGAGSLVGAGMVAGGIGGIVNQMAQMSEHSYAPNSNSGSLNNSDINFVNSRVFGFYPMSIKAEMARKIDRYFSAVGYRTNEMKIPNITGRLNWNYVQTEAACITGAVPQEDLQEIKDMFNNGVTFWHNPATFLDYSQSNGII